jgi:hypothetical protein
MIGASNLQNVCVSGRVGSAGVLRISIQRGSVAAGCSTERVGCLFVSDRGLFPLEKRSSFLVTHVADFSRNTVIDMFTTTVSRKGLYRTRY